MSEAWNQPPPNNTGIRSVSAGNIDWSDKLAPTPDKKTLEYQHQTFTYKPGTGELKVVDSDFNEMTFDVAELIELKAALVTFGIGLSSGSTVNYR